MDIIKQNASFTLLRGFESELKQIYNRWKAQRAGAFFEPLVKSGFKSPYDFFTKWVDGGLLIMNGHAIIDGLIEAEAVKVDSNALTDTNLSMKPYNFQIDALKTCLSKSRCLIKMCTGSGKSFVIALLAHILVKSGYKGLLLVPNINLLEQFRSDIASYNLDFLLENIEMFGGGNKPSFSKPLLISTWQSLQNVDIIDFDFVIADECHRYSSDVTSSIINRLSKTRYRWGFTGTIPDDASAAMLLQGLFGSVETLITSRQLIERGLGTPIIINTLWINYSGEIKEKLRTAYQTALKELKGYQPRNELIENLAVRLMNLQQNTLVLYSHTAHGKTLFTDIVKKLHPDIELKPRDITGPNSFEFQQKLGIYFINGEDDAKTREMTRQALANATGSILVSNYAILGTGINIKALHNLIMASPLKSYTTITQSIGRGIRLHESKAKFNVFDIVDNTNFRGVGGPFVKQYRERLTKSYQPEGYEVIESQLVL